MHPNPERLLAGLRDIAGVEGSWLLGSDGQVHARDLSALYPDATLTSLGPRFTLITSAAAEHLPGSGEDVTLRFQSRTLHLRRSGPLTLVVLGVPTLNVPSLRIGMNLVLRQFNAPPPPGPTASSPDPVPIPRAQPAPPPRPAPAATPTPTPTPARKSSIWGG